MKKWNSLEDFFIEMNRMNTRYVVMRNQECLLQKKFLETHEDIDFLCEDIEEFLKVSGCVPRLRMNDDVHSKILLNGIEVPIDIRTIGDGYYDDEWEKEILKSREMFGTLCYIPNEENLFFSLIYHAIIQKKELSNEYEQKIKKMRNIERITRQALLCILEDFMRMKNYKYTFPDNPFGCINFTDVDKTLIKYDIKKQCIRILMRIKLYIRRLKNTVIKGNK